LVNESPLFGGGLDDGPGDKMLGGVGGFGGAVSAEVSVAKAAVTDAGMIYRSATGTAKSMTPRLRDVNGLSAANSLKNALSGKNQIIDPSKFNNLKAMCDNPNTGHVSITPKDMSQMQDWINSRAGVDVHPLTQELLDSVIGTVNK
jgi:hypothetical protein